MVAVCLCNSLFSGVQFHQRGLKSEFVGRVCRSREVKTIDMLLKRALLFWCYIVSSISLQVAIDMVDTLPSWYFLFSPPCFYAF